MTIHWAPQFALADLKIVTETEVFSGYSKIKQLQLQHALFEGGTSQPLFRELIVRPAAVAILLYDPEQDKVVMIEQFRVGALSDPEGPWVLEIAAGVMEPNESIEQTVYREVKEETGCEILSLVPICSYLTTPGISNEKIHLYCAKVIAPLNEQIQGVSGEGENIKVWVIDRKEAFHLLSLGKIMSSPAVIALQWLKLNGTSLHFPQ